MIVRRYSVLLLLCFALFASVANAASTSVVISEFRTRGVNGAADEFVELYNMTNAAIPIGGWKINGSNNGAGVSTRATVPAGRTIPAKGHYLITNSSASGGPYSGSVAGDQTFTVGITDDGGIALMQPDNTIVDQVGMHTGSAYKEGTILAPLTTTGVNRSYERKPGGTAGSGQDTDNNLSDFAIRTLSDPQNTLSAPIGGETNNPPSINPPANPAATVDQDAAPFNVNLTGNDDDGIYGWTATPGTGVASVAVTSGNGTPNATFTVALQAGFSGPATFTASLSDTVNAVATRAVNITVTPIVVNNDPPTISLPANPITTVAQDAAPFDVSLSGLDDNGVYNWSALTGTGVSAVSVTGGQGTATATFTVTLQVGYSGTATFTGRLSDNVNVPVSQVVNITVTPPPPPPLDHVVISQVYGGGGNAGAAFQNDFVELYNPSTVAFDLGGWTVQYGAATGSTWQAQPLGGNMQPGEYYLIKLATNGAIGTVVPLANVNGDINMSGTNGKVALVSGGDPLDGCPIGDPLLVDLVGYGSTANCREGATNAPTLSVTTSGFRKNGGFTDTNVNGADFVTGTPNPRRTTPVVEIGPYVLSVDPRRNVITAPRDASMNVTFTEAVEVSGVWFDISCASTNSHNDAEVAGAGRIWVITPNQNFQPGEQCTVTVFKDFVHDVDLDDTAPGTDTLKANYVWSFTISTGAAPSYGPEVHLTMGNPSGATNDLFVPNNYLMEKPEYALSYNRDRGTPNWVSWHLASEWIGSLVRVDSFRPDPAVPSDWYRVLHTDYFSSGFDRGHMVPNADRDPETSLPINQATFLMSNMIPQSPDNNQGPWANFEGYLRTLLPANELYIVAGPHGKGGTGSAGAMTTFANGHVTVPAQTWKVALVIPKDSGNDIARVTAASRTIAVLMPNVQGIRNVAWDPTYVVTVDEVEALTGYDFFSELPDAVENSIEAGLNGVNPPGVENQSFSTNEDAARTYSLEAVNPDSDPLTYTIATNPSHGTLSGSGPTRTYTPAPDFNGTDSFTFNVSDGSLSSNTATVTITVLEVNDAPAAVSDSKSTNEDTTLSFSAAELATNDSKGPANESSQTLTVTSVSATADTHGTVSLLGGVVTYQPATNFNGPAGFSYQVCDNGITAGLLDSLCSSSTVTVSVNSVNDPPSASILAPATSAEGSPVTASVAASDADAGDTFTSSWTATKNGSPFAAGSGNSFTFTPDDNGSYVISVVVTDNGGATGGDSETVSVTNVLPVISSVTGPAGPIQLGSSASISVNYSDAGTADTHTALLAWDDGTTSAGVCAAGTCTASRTYAAAGTYNVSITVTDDDGGAASTSFKFIVVYEANESKVTGGGWINAPAGAVIGNPALSGKTTFTINSRKEKGERIPQGNTKLKTDGFDFDSTSYEWLVVAGSKAQYTGRGTVNGSGGYAFLLTVTDGDVTGGGGIDKFRIRIWQVSSGATVYDNAMGASDDIDTANPQQIGSGSIVIHKSK